MFYCEKCATKNQWPYEIYMSQSYRPCECCNTVSNCVDVPSSFLPRVGDDPKRMKLRQSKAQQSSKGKRGQASKAKITLPKLGTF